MNYKKVINEQIQILQKKQNELVKSGSARDDIICLYVNTISKLAEIASNVKEPIVEVNKEVKPNGKE